MKYYLKTTSILITTFFFVTADGMNRKSADAATPSNSNDSLQISHHITERKRSINQKQDTAYRFLSAPTELPKSWGNESSTDPASYPQESSISSNDSPTHAATPDSQLSSYNSPTTPHQETYYGDHATLSKHFIELLNTATQKKTIYDWLIATDTLSQEDIINAFCNYKGKRLICVSTISDDNCYRLITAGAFLYKLKSNLSYSVGIVDNQTGFQGSYMPQKDRTTHDQLTIYYGSQLIAGLYSQIGTLIKNSDKIETTAALAATNQ